MVGAGGYDVLLLSGKARFPIGSVFIKSEKFRFGLGNVFIEPGKSSFNVGNARSQECSVLKTE